MAAPIDAGSIYSDVRIRLDKLNGDIKSVQTSLDKITKASKKTGKESQKGLSKFFSFIKTSGVGSFLALSAVIAGTTKFLKDSEAAARDAQEVYSKFDTVFESIQESANDAADSFSDSFGVAGSTARELLGTTGDLLVGMGATEDTALSLSVQVNEMAADLASFSNVQGGTKRASEALTAALLGETERMKLLGVVIRQTDVQQKLMEKGQENLTGQALMLAKAQVTLEITMEQSQKAMGDYARTADSAANIEKKLTEDTKALKEAVGVGLLPAVTAIRKKLGEWAEAITKVLVESNKLKDANKAVEEGNASYEQKILLLEEERKRLAENTDLQDYNGLVTQANIAATNKRRDRSLNNLDMQISNLKRMQDAENSLAKAQVDRDKESELISTRELASAKDTQIALEELTKRQFEALTPQEQRLQLIDEEINALAVQRAEAKELGIEWQAIQNLINDLYRERDELQKKEFQTAQEIFEGQKSISDEWREKELERIFAINEAEKQAVADRKQELEDKIALTFEYANAVMGIFSAINDLQSANANAELARMERNGATEEEIAERKKELEIEAAKRGKALALLNIAINTASAVVAALVSVPPNVPLSVAVGVTGAIQAAAVMAEPIPEFATGGIVLPSSRGSLINVAENGSPELMLNSGAEGQALLQEFANQIVDKMGGGNQVFYLTLPNGKVLAEAVAPSFNNGIVPLRLS